MSYRSEFTVDAPLALWNKMLDHPLFMGHLWNLYGFQPPYRVTGTKEGVLIVDPSGIKGELIPVAATAYSRVFSGWGAIDHWAVPSFIRAQGLFVFRYREEGDRRLRGSIEISLKGENKVANLLMRLAAGSLERYIDNRFKNNLEDVKKIVFDILYHPEWIRLRLPQDLRGEFTSIF